ncbi:zinc finger, CCHC-type containing protein [Tanacetum coccineum]
MASVNTRVHGVHDEKRVWFEVELHGAQGDREAEVFQVSNDDIAVAQRWLQWLKDGKGAGKEISDWWKIKTGNVLDSCNQRSTKQCTKSGVAKHLGVAWLQQQNRGYNHVYISSEQGHHTQRLKTPIDMLGFFGWLASIKQGMLEPVKVKCIFLGYRKGIVGNKALKDHTFEVESQENVDQGAGLQEVQTQDLMDYQLARNFKWEGWIEDASWDTRSDVYVLSNDVLVFSCGCKAEILVTKGLLVKAKKNILGLEIIRGLEVFNTAKGVKARNSTIKLVHTYVEGALHSVLEGSLLGDCDVEKNGKWSCIYAVGSQEYQMVCTRLDIASADVGMLDKFDRGLQTDVYKFFLDFRTTPWFRSIQAAYMTLTGAWKKEIWLKGLLAESGYELSLVAGIATGALVKGSSRSEVPAQVKGAAYRLLIDLFSLYDLICDPYQHVNFVAKLVTISYASLYLAIAGLSGQNLGVITIANAVFGSNPDISRDILAKAFQTNVNILARSCHQFLLPRCSKDVIRDPKERTRAPSRRTRFYINKLVPSEHNEKERNTIIPLSLDFGDDYSFRRERTDDDSSEGSRDAELQKPFKESLRFVGGFLQEQYVWFNAFAFVACLCLLLPEDQSPLASKLSRFHRSDYGRVLVDRLVGLNPVVGFRSIRVSSRTCDWKQTSLVEPYSSLYCMNVGCKAGLGENYLPFKSDPLNPNPFVLDESLDQARLWAYGALGLGFSFRSLSLTTKLSLPPKGKVKPRPHNVETTTTTEAIVSLHNPNVDNCDENPVKIILGPPGIVQAAKLCKIADIWERGEDFVMSTQEYIRKVVEDAGEDEDFTRGLGLAPLSL